LAGNARFVTANITNHCTSKNHPFKTFTELSHYFIIASVPMKWTSSMLYQIMLEFDGEDEIAAKKDN